MIIIRAITIIFAIAIGYLFTVYLLGPTLYHNICLSDTNTCLEIEYYRIDNSALIHVINTGYWLWYTGKYLIIYNLAEGLSCTTGYDAGIIYDFYTKSFTKACVMSFSEINDYYSKQTILERLFLRVDNPTNYDAFGIMQIFFDKNILFV